MTKPTVVVLKDGAAAATSFRQLDGQVGIPGFGRLIRSMRHKTAGHGVCPLCGWGADDYRRTGLLGCGLCYSALSVPPQESVTKE